MEGLYYGRQYDTDGIQLGILLIPDIIIVFTWTSQSLAGSGLWQRTCSGESQQDQSNVGNSLQLNSEDASPSLISGLMHSDPKVYEIF